MFGNSPDNKVIVPVNFARKYVDIRDIGTTILVKAKPNVSNDELKDELIGVMRSVRKLKPRADDDFAINETDIISREFDSFFGVISIVGWIVGGFSLLVGGFGIANIMFVSVKERTSQIGIQMSLGAKKFFILFQFLFEAVFSFWWYHWVVNNLFVGPPFQKLPFFTDIKFWEYRNRNVCICCNRSYCRNCTILYGLST